MDLTNDLYKKILDNLYDGVYFVDAQRRITYWNKGAEAITGYRPDEVIGKSCHDNILAHIDIYGRNLCGSDDCPAAQALRTDAILEHELFMIHKEGYRIRIFTRVLPVKDDRGQIVGSVELFTTETSRSALARRVEELERWSLIDPLTKVGNRKYVEQVLSNQLDQFKRYGWPFGILFIDIDHFKMINDTYGHDVGDKALLMVAQTIRHGLRKYNIVGRWGGEEFICDVINVQEEQLEHVAERIRLLIKHTPLAVENGKVRLTVSIGATMVAHDDTFGSLMKRADDLMYQSKHDGRDRVTCDSTA